MIETIQTYFDDLGIPPALKSGVAAPPEALAPAHAESADLLPVDQDRGPPWDHFGDVLIGCLMYPKLCQWCHLCMPFMSKYKQKLEK